MILPELFKQGELGEVPIAAGVLYPAFGLLLSPMIAAAIAAKQTDLNKQTIISIMREHKSKFLATDFIL